MISRHILISVEAANPSPLLWFSKSPSCITAIVQGGSFYEASWRSSVTHHGGCRRLNKFEFDDIDWVLLHELQSNARSTYQSMAQKVGLTIPAVTRRIDRLKRAGVITGFRTDVNPRRLGLTITAFVRVAENVQDMKSLTSVIKKSPEVFECYRCAGSGYSFIMKVHVRALRELEAVVNRFNAYASVRATIVSSSLLKRRAFKKSLAVSPKTQPARKVNQQILSAKDR